MRMSDGSSDGCSSELENARHGRTDGTHACRGVRGDDRSLMLDTFREVHTPEGVALRLPAAGPVPRALAWLIDLGIRFGVLRVSTALIGVLGKAGIGLYFVVAFLLLWAYPVVFAAMFHGQTPGTTAMGQRGVFADGAPVGWL